MITLAIQEIREDLIKLCEDNEVMIKVINNYFNDYEKRLCPVNATIKPSDLHIENENKVV